VKERKDQVLFNRLLIKVEDTNGHHGARLLKRKADTPARAQVVGVAVRSAVQNHDAPLPLSAVARAGGQIGVRG